MPPVVQDLCLIKLQTKGLLVISTLPSSPTALRDQDMEGKNGHKGLQGANGGRVMEGLLSGINLKFMNYTHTPLHIPFPDPWSGRAAIIDL